MSRASWKRPLPLAAQLIALFLIAVPARNADLNPAAVTFQLPENLRWTDSPTGSRTALLVGDPAKPGLYVVLNKWGAHKMSRPHTHPNDRFITVISGTWWVGSGTSFNPEATVPMKAGTFVTHYANQVHYDGAKDEDTVLQIVGIGPAPAVPAESK